MSKQQEAMKRALEALEWIIAQRTGGMIQRKATEVTTALREALERMAENARELGLDYDTSAGTQVSKVWWDDEELMAKPIPFVEFYKPVQQHPTSGDYALGYAEGFNDACKPSQPNT